MKKYLLLTLNALFYKMKISFRIFLDSNKFYYMKPYIVEDKTFEYQQKLIYNGYTIILLPLN